MRWLGIGVLVITLVYGCNPNEKMKGVNNMENSQEIFSRGEKAPVEYFIGNAWVKSLVPANDTFNTLVGNVVFEAGARNNWHSHGGGQILIVTDGTGYYQEKGKPKQVVRKGDVIQILPDVVHWHGASADSPMTHIAINTNIQKGIVTWLDRVTDEQFNGK